MEYFELDIVNEVIVHTEACEGKNEREDPESSSSESESYDSVEEMSYKRTIRFMRVESLSEEKTDEAVESLRGEDWHTLDSLNRPILSQRVPPLFTETQFLPDWQMKLAVLGLEPTNRPRVIVAFLKRCDNPFKGPRNSTRIAPNPKPKPKPKQKRKPKTKPIKIPSTPLPSTVRIIRIRRVLPLPPNP